MSHVKWDSELFWTWLVADENKADETAKFLVYLHAYYGNWFGVAKHFGRHRSRIAVLVRKSGLQHLGQSDPSMLPPELRQDQA